ncbi:pyridoxamine 5'-phosphate oxidase family protein [Oceanospirillum sediminis]|uniref:Pyridoxamine 5'-phosphate oxidase family protein n=1 Tax=Oceanospirillum sediminis TaxID=2760088 RepID=A0A839IUV5_9GAMM|nr:pyridoxamine 5'-phosphate oxidase family protein [Oceanospirillum sediminis]MBB1488472.1 pyridoxamine 5'-phosphate oxidase family protein [Oceanospirillum sediminis]
MNTALPEQSLSEQKAGLASLQTDELPHGSKSTVRRGAKRASYKKSEIFHLLDDLKLAHVGFISDNCPVIIPITVWRIDESIYFHVANKSRLQRILEQGQEVCLSLAECSEWVMAKSAYHHSANYRSAVLYCTGERVTDDQEFDEAFKSVINELEADRWQHLRPPSVSERKATALMKLTIIEGSFKSRSGGPSEDPQDIELDVWHGVLPAGSCPFHRMNE